MRLFLALSTTIAVAIAFLLTTNADGRPSTTTLPDLNPGEGWQERAPHAQEGIQARAWSDTAAGCHLVLFVLPISDSVGKEPMRASLQVALRQNELTLATDSTPMRIHGKEVTGVASLKVTEKPARSTSLLACYWNDREPERCRSLCEQSLKAHNKAVP